MGDMDTRIVVFIDNAGFDSAEIYRPYLDQPNIDAVIYWDVFGDYAKYQGAIKWLNGKPLISARIWMRNVNGQLIGPQQVANDINARPPNPLVSAGYSVVPVHAWSMSVTDIVQCVSLLNPAVRVVTPEELVKLMMTNLAPQVPSIISNPTGQVVRVSGNANLAAAANGAGTSYYQWFFNGNSLSGRTNSSLPLSNISLSQSGSYQIVASNSVGTAGSSRASVTVQLASYFPSNCATAPSGLVNWWLGDGNAYDLIGDCNGSLLGGVQFGPGKVGAAFTFDGINDYVSVPFVPSYDFAPAGQFTLMAWIIAQPRSQFQSVVVKCPPSGEWDWGLWIDSNNRFISGLNNFQTLTSTTVVQSGVWHHVAVTYSNGTWSLYVDGAIQAQTSGIYITQSTGSLAFGRKGESFSNPGYFQGSIDEVMIFNRALSDAEVQVIHSAAGNGVCRPVKFTNVRRLADSSIQLSVKGPVADNYEIVGSPDLLNWTPIMTLTNPEGTFSFQETNTETFGRRFFRANIP